MLRVYTAAHCPGHGRTRRLIGELLRQRPHLPLEVIDLDEPNTEQPAFVIGTPTFTWGNRILFLGNPAEEELLARLDEMQGQGN
jgi:hypothetical protein